MALGACRGLAHFLTQLASSLVKRYLERWLGYRFKFLVLFLIIESMYSHTIHVNIEEFRTL